MNKNNQFYLRFLHSVPNAGEVTVYVNDKLIADLTYRGFTEYYPAESGTYEISVYLKNTIATPILKEKIKFDSDIYTFAIMGLAEDIGYNVFGSDSITLNPQKAIIRFANLSPFDTNFDVFINNKKAIENLEYNDITNFATLSPGKYSFKAFDSKTSQVKLQDPNMTLKAGKIYTGYIVGIDGGTPGLQILIPLEGATYIKF